MTSSDEVHYKCDVVLTHYVSRLSNVLDCPCGHTSAPNVPVDRITSSSFFTWVFMVLSPKDRSG